MTYIVGLCHILVFVIYTTVTASNMLIFHKYILTEKIHLKMLSAYRFEIKDVHLIMQKDK